MIEYSYVHQTFSPIYSHYVIVFNAHVLEIAPDWYFGPLQFLFVCDYTTEHGISVHQLNIIWCNFYTLIMCNKVVVVYFGLL